MEGTGGISRREPGLNAWSGGRAAYGDSGDTLSYKGWSVKGDPMAIADQVYQQTKKLPEHLAREVIDFIGYLTERQQRERDRDLIGALESVLKTVCDNPEDQARDRV